jgi:hypothetical protein
MKNIQTLIIAFAFMGLSACSKSDSTVDTGSNNNNGGGNTTPTFYFNCKVNGIATDFKAMTLVKDNPDNPQQLFLVGALSNTELPSLTFTLNNKGGWTDGLSYTLDENDFVNTVEYKNAAKLLFKSTATPASATSGLRIKFDTIKLPKGEYASGTFSGTLQLEENTTSVNITEGKFKVEFLN